ncbi:AfsR/SARP family transcriptional regulator [Jiangella aurantiaca]|uniref:AfsR/SARP family transcriptional regulator n=1 Tax=Jiangella aurantiaca TaxID=2530373 RepID=A0A4R5A1F7_9ACTN|nr:AfsR/SARP family transcriptional regulator [Jiangella aurantiaca]TDD64596.1 AfsR/SARP family transcriptional regulator [Jiangella aurantiaca]
MADEPRFEVLGPVRAWRGDHELPLGSPQQRALLAFLLLQDGAPVTVGQLTAALWDDEPPPAALGIVRSYVSRLRRVLGASVVESVAGGYAVRPGPADLRQFERLLGVARTAQRSGDAEGTATAVRSALRLWHGTPLAGITADFAEFERVRLAQLRLTAREDLAAADIAAGRPAEAAADLTELVAEEPLRERPRELLMLALYRSGRQADALAVFADVQRRLADELGLYPGPDLREMQRRILAADPTLDAPAAPPVPAPAAEAAAFAVRPCQLPPDLPRFAGRRDELARVAAALTASGASVPVVGIEGLAGIGKTAFAVHLGRTLPDFPDGHVFVDLGASADPLAELLHGIGVPAAELPESPGERATLWRTLTSDRRLLVVLDDAGDGEQVRPLMPGSGGAAVVITSRQRVYGVPAAQWLTLGPLAEEDAHALLESLVGADRLRAEPDAVRALLSGTAGLPQIVQAIGERIASRPGWSMADAVRRLGPPGPGAPVRPPECATIEAPYQSMLARLAPEQGRAFLLLAVADLAEVSAATAADVLDLPPGAAAALLESLVDQHLLAPTGPQTYAFPYPLRVFARGRALTADRDPDLIGAIA